MTRTAWVALGAAAVFAIIDWIAVANANKRIEYIAKPATMAALVAVAASVVVPSEPQRWAFIVALVCSAIGDVFLMLPGNRFVAGVAAFFAAHLAYIVGLRIEATSTVALIIGTFFVVAFAVVVGRRILTGVRDADPGLATPVSAYIAVISVMVASAIATQDRLAAAGAIVFMTSDSLIAWNRFVRPLWWAPVAIMITYHLGQTALVLSLLER